MHFLPRKRAIIVLLALVLWVVPASATLFTGTGIGVDGHFLSASADFTVSGGILQVVLTNTSRFDVLVPGDVLTGLFFHSNPSKLTPLSALLAAGSQVFQGAKLISVASGNVGGEWAYVAGVGTSSSGYGIFNFANFHGPELQGPKNGALDGVQYGILSAGDNTATGNKKILESQLIKNSVTFKLSGATGPDFLSTITNVSFQYGTDLCEPNVTGISFSSVPVPATVWLLGSGLLGLGLSGRRRREKKA